MAGFSSPAPAVAPASESIVAFSEEGVTTTFTFQKANGPNAPETQVLLSTTNANQEPVTGFELAGASPKYIKIAWEPASGDSLPAAPQEGSITQRMTLTNSQQGAKRLLLRLKISFNVGGRQVTKVTQVDNIPSHL